MSFFFFFFFLIIFLRTQVRNRRTCTRRVHEHDILSESMLNSICLRAGNTVHVVLFILGEGGGGGRGKGNLHSDCICIGNKNINK